MGRIEYQGRSGLSRTLDCRSTSKNGFFIVTGIAICFGLFLMLDMMPQIFHGHFKYLFSLSSVFQVFCFAFFSGLAWMIYETEPIRVHLHHQRLVYERKGENAVEILFSEIERVRFQRSKLMYGFFLDIKSGQSYFFPINIERLDYILDALRFYRPELTSNEVFMDFRDKALVVDHLLAHNSSYLSRGNLKIIWLYLAFPFMAHHDYKRVKSDPQQFRRDMAYEKKIEDVVHKIHIGMSLAALCILLFWKLHS